MISIVVMLILAGVSLNATVGDNGIISKAKNATYAQSRAVLEEYLNQYYVENYEELSNAENKAVALKNDSKSRDWFYQGAPLGYVVDSDGNSHYFINKDGLPDEIKNQLRGGDAGNKTYADYASLVDVYGVTSDLKVYYCSNGKDSISGIEKGNLDTADTTKEIFAAGSDMAKLITGKDDKNVTLEDLKSVKELTIDKDSGINNLSDMYTFVSLQKLTLNQLTLDDLKGIENATQLKKILFKNCTINDYSQLKNLNKQLEYLYIYQGNDNEINKIFSNQYGIGGTDFIKLTYLGISGIESWEWNFTNSNSNKTQSNLTSIEALKNLSNATKKSIKYLYLNNNNLTTTEPLTDFVSVIGLRLESNNLQDTNGLKNMNSLKYLNINNNELGKNFVNELDDNSLSGLENKPELDYLYMINNTYLKKISYIKNNTKISYLYLAGCTNMVTSDVTNIVNVYNACNTSRRSIDDKYKLIFNSATRIDYANLNLNDDSPEINALKNNTTCTQLNLSGNSLLSNSKLQEILGTMTKLEFLSLKGLSNLSDINFVNNVKNLKELDLRGTKAVDLSLLETNALSLKSIWLDNENTDLTKIQKTLSRLSTGSQVQGTWNESYVGIGITNKNLYKKLSECTELTQYRRYCAGYLYEDLDLSKCTKLTYIFSSCCGSRITVPESCTNLQFDREYPPVLSKSKGIKTFSISWCEWSQAQFDEFAKGMANNPNINDITISVNTTNITSISELKSLKNSNIKSMKFSYSGSTRERWSIVDITGIGELNSLEEVTIYGQSVNDISSLASLSNLKYLDLRKNYISDISSLKNLILLEDLELSNNNISNLYPLKNLTNLGKGTFSNGTPHRLSLENNSIYDTTTIINEQGEKETIRNLDIIAYLNTNGNLKVIYLLGNNGITTYDSINKLTWKGKSGF